MHIAVEYTPSAVKVLENNLKISNQTKGDIFQLNVPPVHQKIG